ncbi:Taurine catabolism dioxygenase TauD/TfdA [Cordyceps javanica]|uniref:Taurine catabolism dioxygenase TauD/TfdA n=1 Tax=Cordyceps javanica TaxID=43265 RepID=A0A545UM86_9HYPO|nr:Taurine catabolism dioxygenase TauD/TfdA [Cordyceps javanica]TQW02014.1 Taurine catabolism dioxygenase TauD/TfdA [Cordyceps javanica]
MLSARRAFIRRAPRLCVGSAAARHSSSNAAASQATPTEPSATAGPWETSAQAPESGGGKAAPWRLKELRQQQGHHKQALISRAGLAAGRLSYVQHSDRVVVQSQDSGAAVTLDAAALRDGCQCAACKDPSSGQRTFASVEIPSRIGVARVREKEDGLGVTFRNDVPRFSADHETTVPWESLEVALGARAPADTTAAIPPVFNAVRARAGITLWDRATIARRIRGVDYEAFMAAGDSDALWAVVLDLVRLGLVYLTGVPRDEASVVRIATRIANIRETFYGRTFDVRAKPNAENVAYTAGYLGLHQDLLYLDPPPKIQILHCLDNSCAGGESLFSDGERAARLLLHQHPALAAPLRDRAVPYAYSRNGYSYARRRPLLHHDADGAFENVFWSPPFQGGRPADEPALGPWLRGARVFEALINGDAAMYQRKMRPGECVLFDNLRVMHGRTAFDAAGGGSRWLRGAYIAQEDFVSVATQIPQALLAKTAADDAVWYDGHADKLRAREAWTAEAQALVDKET